MRERSPLHPEVVGPRRRWPLFAGALAVFVVALASGAAIGVREGHPLPASCSMTMHATVSGWALRARLGLPALLGIRCSDEVRSVDGVPVSSRADLARRLARPHDGLVIELVRGGCQVTLVVTFG